MLKVLAIVLSIVVTSAFAGGGFALYQLRNNASEADFMLWNGPWRVNPSMDLKHPKQRALISLVGLFALRETEVIYYTATMDSDGKPLSSDHDYVLTGTVPEARYWSYTLYGEDDFLIPNENKLYGYNARTVSYTPIDSLNPELEENLQQSYSLSISSEPQDENWLPSGDNAQLAITLRLYNPSLAVYNNLEGIPLPEIVRVR